MQNIATQGKNIIFEGAQGTLLDIDHGTYPYVTSSNTVAGAACVGTGFGPRHLDYILGITKAYTTRVGSGLFPPNYMMRLGKHLAKRGNEFGSVTGRPRRCGWLDMVALRRSIQLNSFSGLMHHQARCVGWTCQQLKFALAYRLNGKKCTELLH